MTCAWERILLLEHACLANSVAILAEPALAPQAAARPTPTRPPAVSVSGISADKERKLKAIRFEN